MSQLSRGENVALTREIPDLATVVVGVTWDAGHEPVLAARLVGATLLLNSASNLRTPEDFVFFNQLVSPDLSVGQRPEARSPDREQVEVDLADVPPDVDTILFVLYVDDGAAAHRTLGQLRSCRIRVLDLRGDRELVASEDLAPGLREETALVLGELYRHSSGWKFRVVGQGYSSGLTGVARDHGLVL